MEAVVYESVGRPVLTDVPEPTAGPGEVLVQPAFVGICGTDVHIVAGHHNRATPPVVLGHEFSGVVTDPNGATGWRAGDRVAVEPLVSCGRCPSCGTGRYNLCADFGLYGVDADGALAGRVAVRADRLYSLPDEVSLRAAALAEPLAVVCHLLRQARMPTEGEPVLVFGGGPIGALTADVARATGARTVIVEKQAYRREFARRGGHELWDETSDVAPVVGFEATGTPVGLESLVAAVAPGGRIGVVGLPTDVNRLDVNAMIGKELTLVGSRVYTRTDFQQALELIRLGQIEPDRFITRVVPLDRAISAGVEAVARGEDVMKVLVNVGGFDE